MRLHYPNILSAILLAAAPSMTNAAMTLLSGPPTCTQTGNLVQNGSFETGSPGPGPANLRYWGTGTTNTPFAVPPSWSSLGPSDNYAVWGSSNGGPPWDLSQSDIIPDGTAAMYFGNGITTFDQPATFNADGSVTYPATPNSSKGSPVRLWQSVPTDVFVAPSYCFGFWASGEAASAGYGWLEGVFGLNVTNVLVGNPDQYFAVPSGSGPQGASRWYEFLLTPLNPLMPIQIEFINWGHVVNSGMATELVLDNVIVNMVPEPASLIVLSIGCIVFSRRRRAVAARLPRSDLPNASLVRRGVVAALCLFLTNHAVHAAFTQPAGLIRTPHAREEPSTNESR